MQCAGFVSWFQNYRTCKGGGVEGSGISMLWVRLDTFTTKLSIVKQVVAVDTCYINKCYNQPGEA